MSLAARLPSDVLPAEVHAAWSVARRYAGGARSDVLPRYEVDAPVSGALGLTAPGEV
jgi:hypothetical protein